MYDQWADSEGHLVRQKHGFTGANMDTALITEILAGSYPVELTRLSKGEYAELVRKYNSPAELPQADLAN